MEKIGFFGGTFDPIHFGHLNLVIELKEKCGLDRVLLCPARVSPTRQAKPPLASPEHRLAMLTLAIEGIPGLAVTDAELSRPPPSYTIDTIRFLMSQEKNEKHFYFLLAEDAAAEISAWKEVEKLLEIASPLVGTRRGFDSLAFSHLPLFVKEKLEKGMVGIDAMDISSTRLRERLKKKLYCGHLIPGKVLDYIYENGLY